MEPVIILGARLRARRAELGLTLLAVATAAGLSVPYVANLEKGRGNPTLDAIVGLAGALGVTSRELLDVDETAGGRIDDVFVGLPAVLVDFGRGKILQSQTEQLAKLVGLSIDEARLRLLQAMALAPHPRSRELNRQDCRRILDAYLLILTDQASS